MKKAGVSMMKNLAIAALVIAAVQLTPGHLQAQERQPVADSGFSARPASGKGLNFASPTSLNSVPALSNSSALPNTGKGTPNTYGKSLKSAGDYRLKLAKNFSLETGSPMSFLSPAGLRYMMNESGMDGGSVMNANSFRRGLQGFRQLRFNVQNFTLGASYNYGQGNGGRLGGFSGEAPQSGRSLGLALHAGLHF
jgi:hypothetical protein